MIALADAGDRIGEAVAYARPLLMPTQQELPAALDALIAAAIQAWEANHPGEARARLVEAVDLPSDLVLKERLRHSYSTLRGHKLPRFSR
jgi:hypothetical protein